MEILLDKRIVLALWISQSEEYESVIQSGKDYIPLQLLDLTMNWASLSVPVPY